MAWLGQEVRQSFRGLRKHPGFTAAVILVLALTIGANTSVFSLVHAVLLRPLPFHQPDRVLFIWEKIANHGADSDRVNMCAANYFEIRQRAQSFSDTALLTGAQYTLTGEGTPELMQAAEVSASFFQLLGVKPQIGRTFLPEEETPGGPGAIVLSYGLWERRFNGDPALVGRTILLDGQSQRVVGVMPQGFQGLFPKDEMWVPVRLTSDERAGRTHKFVMIARLRPGVTSQRAKAEIDSIGKVLEREDAYSNRGRRLRAAPVQEELVSGVRPALLILTGAVLLLLAVGCVNIANLLLARAGVRQIEISIRTALGASWGRIVRQMLVESIILTLFGTAIGLAATAAILRLLPRVIPATSPISAPGLDHVAINSSVLSFSLVLALCVSLIFGLLSTWYSSRPTSVVSAGRGITRSYGLQNVLLAVEIALSLVLVMGASLLVQSFIKLTTVDAGFRPGKILSVNIALSDKYSDDVHIAFFRNVLERIEVLPSVESAAAIDYLPLSSSSGTTRRVMVQDQAYAPGEEPIVQRRVITPEYFRTLEIPLKQGRSFDRTDGAQAPLVVIINETLARLYWPGRSPLGSHLRIGLQGDVANNKPREIVGVVADVKDTGLALTTMPEVYLPFAQQANNYMSILVRSATNHPATLISAVRRAVWSVDANQPVVLPQLLTDVVANAVWLPRLNTFLLIIFAGVTLGLALVGIHGLLMQTVGERTSEIGIRMALGADRGSVLRLILLQGLGPLLTGAASGLLLILGGGRLLANQLYSIHQNDPITLAVATIFVLGVAGLAMLYPALRATYVDPITALRHK